MKADKVLWKCNVNRKK